MRWRAAASGSRASPRHPPRFGRRVECEEHAAAEPDLRRHADGDAGDELDDAGRRRSDPDGSFRNVHRFDGGPVGKAGGRPGHRLGREDGRGRRCPGRRDRPAGGCAGRADGRSGDPARDRGGRGRRRSRGGDGRAVPPPWSRRSRRLRLRLRPQWTWSPRRDGPAVSRPPQRTRRLLLRLRLRGRRRRRAMRRLPAIRPATPRRRCRLRTPLRRRSSPRPPPPPLPHRRMRGQHGLTGQPRARAHPPSELAPTHPHPVAPQPRVPSLPTAARETASSAAPAAVDDRQGPARVTVASGWPQRGLLGSASGSGSTGAPPLTFFFGLFAALAAVIALAAQRPSRWLRLSPDLGRPPLFVSVLERPG